jgi:hypothetical protein
LIFTFTLFPVFQINYFHPGAKGKVLCAAVAPALPEFFATRRFPSGKEVSIIGSFPLFDDPGTAGCHKHNSWYYRKPGGGNRKQFGENVHGSTVYLPPK